MNTSAAAGSQPVSAGPASGEPADIATWRRRWRSAGEALFPTLMADPPSYAGAVETIGALAAELGGRRADLAALVAAMSDPDAFLVAVCGGRPPGAVPAALLVGVACGMRERDLITEEIRRDRRDAIARSRAAGDTWAVLNGPESIEDVTGGASGVASCTHLHVATGTELRATVDAWSPEPYRIDIIQAGVVPPRSWSFDRREPWIQEFRRCRQEIGDRP